MHHAECIVGDSTIALSKIPKTDQNGPDVRRYSYVQLGIDDARALKQEAAQRPVSGDTRVFIIVVRSATLEAQNALLKLFEEPAPGVRFYLLIPKEDILIETLRSRLNVRRVETPAEGALEIAREFITHTYAKRLSCIAERTKNKEDAWCDLLIRGLEEVFRKEPVRGAQVLLMIERYMHDPGASKKMLLEHLALSLQFSTSPPPQD